MSNENEEMKNDPAMKKFPSTPSDTSGNSATSCTSATSATLTSSAISALLSFVTLTVLSITLAACGGSDKAPFNYRGLAFTMPADQLVDSMLARGFAVDSAASDSGRTVVLAKPSEPYRVLLALNGAKVQAVQENYTIGSNDSTRMLWQQLRDGLEQELGAWPDCPILKDDHKVANFDTGDGFISVILENTYTPTLNVRYTVKAEQ